MHIPLHERVNRIWRLCVHDEPRGHLILQEVANAIKGWDHLFCLCYVHLDYESSKRLSDALSVASRKLLGAGFYGAAIRLLIDAWNKCGERQRYSNSKIYRAGIGFYISEVYLQIGDKGAAFWWQLHALADDYLEGSTGGGAKIVLETILGVSQNQLFSDLKKIAAKHREDCQATTWQQNQHAFAEDAVVELAIGFPQYASMFAYQTSEVEFPISPGYLNTLLEGINRDNQGKNLEYIACYLFLHVPGCTPAHNLLDKDRTSQTDVMIRNLTPMGNLVAEMFGRHFIIECKNWAEPVGSAECGYFLHRINSMHCTFGVMLAKTGVTGSRKMTPVEATASDNSPTKSVIFGGDKRDEIAAMRLIRDNYHEDGVTLVVLKYEHLKQLADQSKSLRTMLFEEIELFRFGNSQSTEGSDMRLSRTTGRKNGCE